MLFLSTLGILSTVAALVRSVLPLALIGNASCSWEDSKAGSKLSNNVDPCRSRKDTIVG